MQPNEVMEYVGECKDKKGKVANLFTDGDKFYRHNPPKYKLVDAEAMHKKYPKRFLIPSKTEIAKLLPDDFAKLSFNGKERMWVKIIGSSNGIFKGELANSPVSIKGLNFGDLVEFRAKHIYDVKYLSKSLRKKTRHNPPQYEAFGDTSGSCGHKHPTLASALKCSERHHKAVQKAYPQTYPSKAYGDRYVRRIDRSPLSDTERAELEKLTHLNDNPPSGMQEALQILSKIIDVTKEDKRHMDAYKQTIEHWLRQGSNPEGAVWMMLFSTGFKVSEIKPEYRQLFNERKKNYEKMTEKYFGSVLDNPPGKALFPLGQTVMTEGVRELASKNSTFASFVILSLERHSRGDWGDLDNSDKQANERALHQGDLRIFSAYKFQQPGFQTSIYIITEADRSSTTILFPEEY